MYTLFKVTLNLIRLQFSWEPLWIWICHHLILIYWNVLRAHPPRFTLLLQEILVWENMRNTGSDYKRFYIVYIYCSESQSNCFYTNNTLVWVTAPRIKLFPDNLSTLSTKSYDLRKCWTFLHFERLQFSWEPVWICVRMRMNNRNV